MSNVPYWRRVKVRALLFDVYGTLVDVQTNERAEAVFRSLAHTLTYAGIVVDQAALRGLYRELVAARRAASTEQFPDFDVVDVWRDLVTRLATDYTRTLPAGRQVQLPVYLAELHRALARKQLRAYDGAQTMLQQLRERYRLAVATDGQQAFVGAELEAVGLRELFDLIVVSSALGCHKPDRRFFTAALEALGVPAAETLYLGNDPYRDMLGAQRVGMRTVLFRGGRFEPAPPGVALPPPDFRLARFADLPTVLALAESDVATR